MLPHYGQCTVGLIDAILGAFARTDLFTVNRFIKVNSSFLPGCFNKCLARALAWRDQGVITHAAMIHADIAAEARWLQILWGELWYHGADVVAAVSPIKNPTGRISTAIGDSRDRWNIKRCLYFKDLQALPDTFGPEHVCGDNETLLINTGCWLADLRKPWWDNFAFDTHSRIITRDDGSYEVQNRTEDWEWSYHLAAYRARYLVTQKVHLLHEGNYSWPNGPTSTAG